MGLLLSPKLMPKERSAPLKKDNVCGVREGLRTWVLMAIFSALSPETWNPTSPHTIVVFYTFSLPESRVSDNKGDFVHWPCKSSLVSLADSGSLLVKRNPLDFIAKCNVGVSSWLWCSELGRLMWNWDFTLLRVNLWSLNSLPESQLPHIRSRVTLFESLPFLPVLWLLL